MEFELTEQQCAFQRAARDFALGELAPHAADWDANKVFPVDTIRRAGQLGFCGMYCDPSSGGLGISRLDTAIILEELAAGCTSTAAYISIHNMASWMVCQWGTAALQAQWAQALTAGNALASYCLTESNAGSDAGNLRSTARRDGEFYIINGSKAFISGAGATQLLVVMARTGSQADGAAGISAFAVPADAAGISYGKNESKMGWNSQPTRSVVFEEVRVPLDCRLGQEGEGYKIAMRGLDGGRINIASCSVGAAQATLNLAQQHVQDREQFGQPLASFQAVQFKLADMLTNTVAARQMVRLAASKLDANAVDQSTYCAMAKRFATDLGFSVCNEAMQLHGGYGYMREYSIERFLRDTRVHQILEGSNEIMRVITARHLLTTDSSETIR